MIFGKIKSKSRDYNPQFFGIENYIKNQYLNLSWINIRSRLRQYVLHKQRIEKRIGTRLLGQQVGDSYRASFLFTSANMRTYLKTQTTSADDHDQSFDSHCCRFFLNLLHLVDSPYLTSSPSLKLLDALIENKSVRPCWYDGIYVRKAIPSLQHQKRTGPNFCPPFRSKRIWNFNIYSEKNNSEVWYVQ